MFVEEFGISNALELGVASNTVGLIAACVIGGPIANYLLNKHKISPSNEEDVTVGAYQESETRTELSHYGVLWAWLILNLTLMLGYSLSEVIDSMGLKLPLFVSCLIAGILIGNIGRALFKKRRTQEKIAQGRKGLAMISDICLGMFLTMALMGLRIWDLDGLFGYISVILEYPDFAFPVIYHIRRLLLDGKKLRLSGDMFWLRRHYSRLDCHSDCEHDSCDSPLWRKPTSIHCRATSVWFLC